MAANQDDTYSDIPDPAFNNPAFVNRYKTDADFKATYDAFKKKSHKTEQSQSKKDRENHEAQKHEREKSRQSAAWWGAFLTNVKLFFMTSLFTFFSQLNWKILFQTTYLHYVMLPIAVAFETFEVITDTIQLIKADKTDYKLWISLGVNILRLAGVSVAVGLILSGLAAASTLFATVAGVAFTAAVGVKTIYHVGMSVYSVAKSMSVEDANEKSDLRHEALKHAAGAGIAGTLGVCIGFVMLHASVVMAAVAGMVCLGGGIIGFELMSIDYLRKKKMVEQYNFSRDTTDSSHTTQKVISALNHKHDQSVENVDEGQLDRKPLTSAEIEAEKSAGRGCSLSPLTFLYNAFVRGKLSCSDDVDQDYKTKVRRIQPDATPGSRDGNATSPKTDPGVLKSISYHQQCSCDL